MTSQKRCTGCRRLQAIECYHWRNVREQLRHSQCGTCRSTYGHLRRLKSQERAVEALRRDVAELQNAPPGAVLFLRTDPRPLLRQALQKLVALRMRIAVTPLTD